MIAPNIPRTLSNYSIQIVLELKVIILELSNYSIQTFLEHRVIILLKKPKSKLINQAN